MGQAGALEQAPEKADGETAQQVGGQGAEREFRPCRPLSQQKDQVAEPGAQAAADANGHDF